MTFLLSYYSGTLTDALTFGSIIGAIVGVVVFSAPTASESISRIVGGLLVGGLGMGVYQGLRISNLVGQGLETAVDPSVQERVQPFGDLVLEGLLRTIQAGLIGGLFVVVFLAPFQSLKGAVGGGIIGIIAGILSWGLLQLTDASIPTVIFLILILGIVVAVIETIGSRN